MAGFRLKLKQTLVGGGFVLCCTLLALSFSFKEVSPATHFSYFLTSPHNSRTLQTAHSNTARHPKERIAQAAVLEALRTLETNTLVLSNPHQEKVKEVHQLLTVATRGKRKTKQLSAGVSYVTGLIGLGRMGNDMFIYACVLAAALRHNLTAAFFLSGNTPDPYVSMLSVFQLTSDPYNDSYTVDKTIKEAGFGKYNAEVEHRENFGRFTTIQWYLQSFKYFKGYESVIRSEFALTESYGNLANAFLTRLAAGRRNVTFVSVHVRRGDMVDNELYIPAPITYIVKAMDYFNRKYGERSTVQFVVASNDLQWTTQALAENWNSSNIAYTNGTVVGDMAILSRCNHSVITLGSYGWWSAWLARGEVVYFSNFIPKTSWLAGYLNEEDYYPDSWIGMT